MSVLLFLKDVVRRPRQMGAIAPSGPELARVMVQAAAIDDTCVIAELGAGTGPITAAIRELHPNAPLIVFEPGADLAKHLRERFPGVEICEKYAQDLPAELDRWGHPTIDRVLCGLPWTIFTEAEQDAILGAVTSRMSPEARFVTFQYVHAPVLPGAQVLKKLLSRHFEEIETTRTAWKNVPPAFAFVAKRPKRS